MSFFGRLLCRNAVFFVQPRQLSSKTIPPRGKPPRSVVSWRTVAITAIAGSAFYGFLAYARKVKHDELEKERKRVLGKARIGGTFELVDCDGKSRTSQDFLGQWLLIYFGFTHCPDVCPDELEKLAQVVDELHKSKTSYKVQPIFITVDPYRDTPEAIKKYCAEFSPKLLGLTGTVDQISKACKAYRVYFSAGPKDQDEDYIVDHTIIMYLVDPEGNFVDYYGQNRNVQQMVTSILFQMNKYKKASKTEWFTLDVFKNT